MRQFNLTHSTLLSLVPIGPAWTINWSEIWNLWPELPALDHCPQDPIHHAEGDVGLHTRMVTEALVALPEWRDLDVYAQGLLFWSAILHDIGKPATTRKEEDGRITARNHARVGTQMARQMLYDVGAPKKRMRDGKRLSPLGGAVLIICVFMHRQTHLAAYVRTNKVFWIISIWHGKHLKSTIVSRSLLLLRMPQAVCLISKSQTEIRIMRSLRIFDVRSR